MIILIFAILFIAVFLYLEWRNCGIEFGTILLSFLIGIIGCLLGVVVVLIGSCIFEGVDDSHATIEYHDKVELVALKDNFQIEGTAFIFSSVVDEELKYTYIYETDMGMKSGSVYADNTYIKYIDENEAPYIQHWERRPKSDFLHWLFIPGTYHSTIYLPEGSVIENVFEIDLE